MSDDVFIDDSTPVFESIEDLHLRSIPSSNDDDVVVEGMDSEETTIPSIPRTGKRGRPKGSKNRAKGALPFGEGERTSVSGRLAKDVSLRAQQVLKGASSLPALWRPPFQMYDVEAQNIADPLASYATRQAEISPIVAKLVDDFDLIAAGIGVVAYAVRVYKDNQTWIAEHGKQEQWEREQHRPRVTRQESVGNGNQSIRQNQSTERPQYQTEVSSTSVENIPEPNVNPIAISVPYSGDL
jgi:hypothetical protein